MNELEFKKYLGDRIKELRTKNGLTQEMLAEKIGVGERNLSKIECGEIFFKLKTLIGLLNTLNIEPNELFDLSTSKKQPMLKETLVNAINNDLVDVDLLYRIYRSIKY